MTLLGLLNAGSSSCFLSLTLGCCRSHQLPPPAPAPPLKPNERELTPEEKEFWYYKHVMDEIKCGTAMVRHAVSMLTVRGKYQVLAT